MEWIICHLQSFPNSTNLSRIKQLEDQKAQITSDLHEMDKPLARDKDDQDRDAHLKAIERAEDPMLQYMRKKQKKAISGLPRKLFTHHYTIQSRKKI